jgi:hypothetical protein
MLASAIEAFGLPPVKEAELAQFRGELYARADRGVVSLSDSARGLRTEFDRDGLRDSAAEAMPGIGIDDAMWLDRYDDYYYSRDGRLPLPVLRVRYNDPPRTWLYFDPSRGAVVRKEERLSRLNRWLYRGLHSFDFPFLHQRRPLWDVALITLSVGGIVLSMTTLNAGWRRVFRRIRIGRTRRNGT